MDNISIVINMKEEKIKECINYFSPVIGNRECEIILINNEIEKIDIPYGYSIYKFSNEYDKFKKYCFELCENRKVIILEKGLNITSEIIDEINNKIDLCNYCNLKFKIKRYIGEDIFFIDEDTILYNRGIKGFNEYSNIIIEDYSFLNISEYDIEKNIEKLIERGLYKELYVWFENVISNKKDNYKMKFYEVLEKKKSYMERDRVNVIEEMFLKGREEDYKKYLYVKELIKDDKIDRRNEITNNIKEINIKDKDLYFSWLLDKALIDGRYFIDCMSCVDVNLRTKLMAYLFNNSKHFHDELYDYIVRNVKEKTMEEEDSKLGIYLDIIKSYMELVFSNTMDQEERKRIVELYNIYIEKSIYLLGKESYRFKDNNEKKFIEEIKKSQLNLFEEKVEEAILILKNAASMYLRLEGATDCYIQALRNVNSCYRYKLSICMIVKNEERNIERCLFSLKPLLDSKIAKLIIVDTGSEDNTVEIAKKYNADIFYHSWRENFSEARNYSLSKSEGEYIFIIDADEEIEEDEIKKLIDEFNGNQYKYFNTFTFKLKNYTDQELKEFAIFTQPLIFKNDGAFYYDGTIHNQPIYKDPIKHLEIEIIHYGYIMTEDIREKKFQRTSNLLKKELEKDPRNLYYRFQLATSYSMYGNYKEALKQAKIYMRIIREENLLSEKCLMLYNNAAYIHINNNLLDEAIKICDEGLSVNPNFIDFIYYKAIILFSRERYQEALQFINRYIEVEDSFYSLDIVNSDSYSFYTLAYKDDVLRMALLTNYRLGNYLESIKYMDLLNNHTIIKNCIHAIVDSCFKLKDYLKIVEFYEGYVKNGGDESINGIFRYFIVDSFKKCNEQETENIFNEFKNIDNDFAENLKSKIKGKKGNETEDILFLIKNYDINSLDSINEREIFDKVLPLFNNFKVDTEQSADSLFTFKRFAQFIMHRSKKLSFSRKYSPDKLVLIFNKYINICSRLMGMGRRDLLESRERYFLAIVLNSIEEFKNGNNKAAVNIMNIAVESYREMEYMIQIVIKTMTSDFRDDECVEEYERDEYSNTIKNELVKSTSGDFDNILKVFELYNKIDLYDEDLLSLYSVVLTGQNRLEEAERVLIKGIDKYDDNTHLILTLGRVYHLKHDNKKAVECYVKAKMFDSEAKVTDIKEILSNDKKLKILHGTVLFSDKVNEMIKFINNRGLYAKTLNYYPKDGKYNADYVMNLNSIGGGDEILKGIAYAASKLISEFDIFHFHFGTTLSFNDLDLKILNELNKKIFAHFWGYDVRMYSKAIKLNPYFNGEKMDEDKIKVKLDMMSKYIDDCIVGDYEINEYVKDWFKEVHVINPMIDIKKYIPPEYKKSGDKILIVHAPTSRRLKGTEHVLRAIENLKMRYNFDFQLVEGLSHDAAVEIYKKADLIIDQMITGTYGMLSLESMALGKPVICYISDFMKDKYPNELPIISANLHDLGARLEYVLKNRDMLKSVGEEGRKFVEKYHDIDKEINKLIDLYKS